MDDDIGLLIRELRKSKGLTQKELAEKSDVSRSYLSDVENNRYNPSINFVKNISHGLSDGNLDESYEYFRKFIYAIF